MNRVHRWQKDKFQVLSFGNTNFYQSSTLYTVVLMSILFASLRNCNLINKTQNSEFFNSLTSILFFRGFNIIIL